VRVFLWAEKGGKKREIWVTKNLVTDSKVSIPLYMEMEKKIFILFLILNKYVSFFFLPFLQFSDMKKGLANIPITSVLQ